MTTKPPNVILGEWRASQGLSFAQAGLLFGVSAVNFRAWERGEKRPAAGPRREAMQIRVGIPADAWVTPKERDLVETAREATRTPSTPPPAPPKVRTRTAPARKTAPKRASKKASSPGPKRARAVEPRRSAA